MRVFVINKNNVNLLNDLNGENGSKNGTVLFHHPQCPHCVSLRPEWEQMKESINREDCDIYEVNGEDMQDVAEPIARNINGFPTIVNLNDGKMEHFEQERNVQNMRNFVLSNLSHNRQVSNNATRKLKTRKVSFKINKDNELVKERSIANQQNIINSIRLYHEKLKRNQFKKRNPIPTRKARFNSETKKRKTQAKRKRQPEKKKGKKKRKTQKK